MTQLGPDGQYLPVCFYSKKLTKCQCNYAITDKEGLALILAVRAFRIYLSGEVTVFTDHQALQYIHRNATKNQRLLRWSLELQPYNLNIKHIKGSDNVFADYISRHVG